MPPGFPTIVTSQLWIWDRISQKWVAAYIYTGLTIKGATSWYKQRGYCICIVKRQANEKKL